MILISRAFSSPTVPMKFLQLSLRDLLWLVLVIALSLGWWLDHYVRSSPLDSSQLRLHSGYRDLGHFADTGSRGARRLYLSVNMSTLSGDIDFDPNHEDEFGITLMGHQPTEFVLQQPAKSFVHELQPVRRTALEKYRTYLVRIDDRCWLLCDHKDYPVSVPLHDSTQVKAKLGSSF
jgi:hypothetical protein